MRFDEESETNRLEAEIAEEEKPVPESRLSRFRRKGALILNSKQVLMVIVLLNVIDCLLVTGELILDIHYIKEVLEESDLESQRFVDQMQARYPDHLSGHDIDHLGLFHSAIHEAQCFWDEDLADICSNSFHSRSLLETGDEDYLDDDHSSAQMEHSHVHGPWENVAHGLHKASIAILGILFIENLLKIFCMGKRFFHRKIEVFDALIVCASFILDLVFLKGIIAYPVQDGVLVLSFLLPWRVIRVLNSLIVAIIDHEHFRLKMMYKEKRKLANKLQMEQHKNRILKDQLRNIEDFLEKEGMPRWKFIHYTHFDDKNSSVASMASFALKGLMDGFFNVPYASHINNANVGPEGNTNTLYSNTETNALNNNTDDHTDDTPSVKFDLGDTQGRNSIGSVRESNGYIKNKSDTKRVSFQTQDDLGLISSNKTTFTGEHNTNQHDKVRNDTDGTPLPRKVITHEHIEIDIIEDIVTNDNKETGNSCPHYTGDFDTGNCVVSSTASADNGNTITEGNTRSGRLEFSGNVDVQGSNCPQKVQENTLQNTCTDSITTNSTIQDNRVITHTDADSGIEGDGNISKYTHNNEEDNLNGTGIHTRL